MFLFKQSLLSSTRTKSCKKEQKCKLFCIYSSLISLLLIVLRVPIECCFAFAVSQQTAYTAMCC